MSAWSVLPASFLPSREQIRSVIRQIGMRLTGPAAAERPTAAEGLPDDPATLKRMVQELLASLREHRRDNEALRHRLDLLLSRLYEPRGERFNPNQPLLFADAAADTNTGASPEPALVKESRRCRPRTPHAKGPTSRSQALRVARGRAGLSGLRLGAHRHRRGQARSSTTGRRPYSSSSPSSTSTLARVAASGRKPRASNRSRPNSQSPRKRGNPRR